MKWEFEDYLKVVEMSYQKMSQKEIAKIYGVSSGRIGQVLYRGYMQLKRKNRTLIADALISLQVKKNNLIEFGNKYDFTKKLTDDIECTKSKIQKFEEAEKIFEQCGDNLISHLKLYKILVKEV